MMLPEVGKKHTSPAAHSTQIPTDRRPVQPGMSRFQPSGGVSPHHMRYNGVPLISYSVHKKKRRPPTGGSGHKSGSHSHKHAHPNLWDDYYRCLEYVGEPLMLIPKSSGGGARIPHGFYYAVPAYASYPAVLNYPGEYFHGITQHQPAGPVHPPHHRDSFSSCSSSSDTASSGSSSPVHFSYWDSANAVQDTNIQTNSPRREWIYKSQENIVPEISLGVTLRVMSYNILADQYASKKMYSYCPAWALAWSYRKEKIREDIELHAPDVACLQEVAMGEFYQYFLDTLRMQGYNGIFSPKSRANTMDTKNRQSVDGCAVIFRNDRFELVHQHLVEFNQLAIKNVQLSKNADGSDDMINRVMTKDNIALCALLRVTEAAVPSYILVVNAHIHWDPECCDVKLIQTMLLMCEVEKLLRQMKSDFNVENIPMIFCGDLNSLPDSGVIEFLENGRISVDHQDFKDLPYRACLQKLSSQGRLTPEGHFTHPFAFTSVYNQEMPFTNFTPEFNGVIDYVFVSKDFHTLSVLGAIENTWIDENKPVGFPCHQVPSDHLPLVCEVELRM
ncbi:LOW QUALITY PROTEIN: CCR4-NOT transcription complex subunit 6-like [Paramacrobiotus metropolitanus]|uniref:LOW QUALITY PROTEIN: CCR4-NOT transcription complex subunit 6-like n=1 Tax=Paramacrobiotus metropolitanus TaxID=2943436 RepID=UPI0024464109|nr:LOW QUALITY PROTEIN: CCR4-NOT transcription complex subunit 6-like [Paramacrobiotus metropolitanus]